MGHQSSIKALRHQLRDIAKEHLPAALTTEILVDAGKRTETFIAERLNQIDINVMKELQRIDEQSKAFRGLILKDAAEQISRELFSMNVSFLSWQEALQDRLQLANIDLTEFGNLVNEKKTAIEARLKAEAEARMAEEKRLADEAKAAAKAVIDGPPVTSDVPTETYPGTEAKE